MAPKGNLFAKAKVKAAKVAEKKNDKLNITINGSSCCT